MSVRNKTEALRKEFELINANHDEYISKEELFNYLDKKSNTEFDRSVAHQLFERMDKNYDGRVTVNEFIKVFIEADEILKNKIQNSKTYIEDYTKQRQEAARKLEEIRRTETLNSYGIMEGSVLNVVVVEAHGLKKTDRGGNDPYVLLQVGNETAQSGVSSSANPTWNENFQFPIVTGSENLVIMIMDYDAYTRDDHIGQVQISLNTLRSQSKTDDWFDLYDKNGDSTNGRIRLNLQWIHSRVKYLSDVVNKWDTNIRAQEEDLKDYEQDYYLICQPFEGIRLLNSGKYQNQGPQAPMHDNYSPAPAVNTGPGLPSKLPFITKDEYYIPRMVSFVYLIFALFVCFHRAVFLDVFLAGTFIVLSEHRNLDAKKMIFLTGGVIFSAILDMAWLGVYTSNWWASNELTTPKIMGGVKRFVIVFSFFLFFTKFAVIFFYQMLARKANAMRYNDSYGQTQGAGSKIEQSPVGQFKARDRYDY